MEIEDNHEDRAWIWIIFKKFVKYNFNSLRSKLEGILNKNVYVLIMSTFAKKGWNLGLRKVIILLPRAE